MGETVMRNADELSNNQLDRFEEFLKTTFLLDEDELKALDKQMPMTQEMFDHLCSRLTEIGADRLAIELMLDYPDLLQKSSDRIEKELGLSDNDYGEYEMSEEEIKESFVKLMERIENEAKGKNYEEKN